MVQAIENRADLDGKLLSIAPDNTRPGHVCAVVAVTSAAPVEGYANMFGEAAGSQLEVIVPSDKAGALRVGEPVSLRIRRVGPTTVLGE
jgi:hypothetical protein